MLSTRKPSGISSRAGGVAPRERRKNDWLPQAATYNVLPSSDSSTPFAPAASLPGTFCQPEAVCHSQSSPLRSPAHHALQSPRACRRAAGSWS